MANTFIFADEAGCLSFTRKPNVSRYFILCTVTMTECGVGNALLDLRRRLAWSGESLGDYFHAAEDKQTVRDAVFDVLTQHEFSIQATIMEKAKALPHTRDSQAKFYKYGYFYHFKHGIARVLDAHSRPLVTTASLGTRRERVAFEEAVSDVMRQTNRNRQWKTDFMPCQSDPCLQVADYCAWAIQRKWERGDTRSYDLVAGRITYEYDLWAHGTTLHY